MVSSVLDVKESWKKVKLELVVGKWEAAKTLWQTVWLIQPIKTGAFSVLILY